MCSLANDVAGATSHEIDGHLKVNRGHRQVIAKPEI